MDFNWVFAAFDQSKSDGDARSSAAANSETKADSSSTPPATAKADQTSTNLIATRASHYSEGDWAKALSACNEIIDQGKPVFGDFIVRANTYLKLNRFSAAIEDCTLALRMNSRSSAAYCTRAFAFRSIGKLGESLADLNKAQELSPDDTVIYSNRAAVYRARSEWRKVVDDCSEIIQRKETEAGAYTMRGAAYGKLRELELALIDCKKAVELAPADPSIHANLALVYSMMAKWDKAVHESTQAIILGQPSAASLTPRAIAYGKLRRFELALADLAEAIRLDRTHLNAWSNRVIIYTKLGRWSDVISDCTQILEMDPDNVQAYNSRGVAYHMVGNNLLAERDLTFVVEKETVNMVNKGRALGARAAVYCAVSKWNLAVEDCQRARVLDPQGSDRYKVIQQSARGAADKAEKEAKENAEMMMQKLIEEEAIEKQRSVDAREKKKKKKQKQKKKNTGVSRTGSFDLLRNMASTDSSEFLANGGTFDSEDNEMLGLIDCSDDESEDEDTLELENPSRSPHVGNDEEVCGVERTLFGIHVSDEVRQANTPDKNFTPQKISSVAIEQIPKSKLQSFTPSTPKKDKSDEELAKIYESTIKSSSKALSNETPNTTGSSAASQDGQDKSSLSLVDMLMFFLPTFPMFNYSEQQRQSSPRSPTNKTRSLPSSVLLSIEPTADGEGETIVPIFQMVEGADQSEEEQDSEYGNYLEIMSDTEVSSLKSSDDSDLISGHLSPTFSNPPELKRETSAESDGFKTAMTSARSLGKIMSLNSLSKAAMRSRSDSFTLPVPPPTKDDVVSVGKLAFSKAHVIGRGSFGTMVYAGAHAEFGRAAIKAISKEGWARKIVASSAEGAKDGALDESLSDALNDSFGDATPSEVMAIADRKILLMISQKGTHKSVVRYFGFEEDSNFMYLALELCEVSLWSIFNDHKFSETRSQFRGTERRQQFTIQLLDGIKFLHSHQIVHGDLRPKNVLFDYSGQLKIADFGLAQKVSFDDDSFSWQHGGPDGIGGWFAPEVYLKERKTMAVDMFSAGCMIFWVATNGQHPFNNNPFNVVQGLYQASAISENAEISDLVGWMVAHKSEDRPTIEAALSHPFLWTHSNRMLYLTDVGNKIDQFKDALDEVCLACVTNSSAAPSTSRRWSCRCGGGTARSPWREKIPKDLMDSLLRRRKYPADTTVWFVRFFRNLDQHFHDQTDEGVLCLKETWIRATQKRNKAHGSTSPPAPMSDEEFLKEVRSSAIKQRELVSSFVIERFPTFFLSVWRQIGDFAR